MLARGVKKHGEGLEDAHRFLIPDGCHWDDVYSTAQSIGGALRHAMREIERVKSDILCRVFGTGDWVNKEKFTGDLNKVIIEGFSAIDYKKRSVL